MAEPEPSLSVVHLNELPEFDPPAHLWERIEAVRKQRLRRRATVRWGGGIAAVLAIAAVLLVLPGQPPGGQSGGALAQLERRSHELEQAYADLSQPASPFESEADLRAVEHALQQAYDRGAAADELMPLWQQRNEVLSSLIALAADGAQLTRI
jgi:hypothetical protein